MKLKVLSISTLLICLIAGNSFAPAIENIFYKNTGNVQVVVDGNIFELREKDKYRAQLLHKTALTDGAGRMEKFVMASLMFYGNSVTDELGNSFEEKLDFDYAFNEGSLGEVSGVKIELHHLNKDYYQVNEKTSFRINKIDWSADRRSYVMNAEFECQMRQWGFPWESQPVVKMKGKLEGIHVSVPAWVQIKNPNQTALDK